MSDLDIAENLGASADQYAMPDLGMTNLSDVAEDARRITGAVDLPLLVDIDVGWGNAFNIARTIKEMINAGVAAVPCELDPCVLKRLTATMKSRRIPIGLRGFVSEDRTLPLTVSSLSTVVP